MDYFLTTAKLLLVKVERDEGNGLASFMKASFCSIRLSRSQEAMAQNGSDYQLNSSLAGLFR